MADIGRGLRAYLVSKTSVTDEVGTRIYPGVLPQDATLPAVVYNLVFAEIHDVLTGSSGSLTSTVQIDVYSDSHISSNGAAEAIRLVTQGYSGAMGSETINSVRLRNRNETYEPPTDGSDLGRHRVMLELDITHTNTIPSF
tara:strand:- start:24 stop:446 length:423 start_codon:yes stop_codon:yes gene_type:complete